MATITPGMLAGLRYSKSMSDNDLHNEHNRKNSAMFNSTIGNIQPLEIARQQDSTFQTGYPFSNSNPIDNPPKQYAATKWDEGSSAIGTEQAQDAFGSFMSTRGEGDPRSNERYQQLLARRDDIVAEIHKLMSEISWQETLKARNLTKDPLWEEAKYNWIYKGDDSGMKNIRDIEVKRKSDEEQRYWQAQENRKQRESTEKLAKESKEASDDARLRDLEDQYDLLKQIYYVAKEESENAPDDVKLQRELKRAELNLRHAARKAKKTDELKEILNIEGSTVAKSSPSPTSGTSGDKGAYLKNFGGTVVGWQINFNNAKGANEKLKLLNDALNAGFTEQELGVAGEKARLEKIIAAYAKNKKEWEAEQEKYYNLVKNTPAGRIAAMWTLNPGIEKYLTYTVGGDKKVTINRKKYGGK